MKAKEGNGGLVGFIGLMRVMRLGLKFFFFSLFFFLMTNSGWAGSSFRYRGNIPLNDSISSEGSPTTIAVDYLGRLMVVFSGSNSVQVFDQSGKFLFIVGQNNSPNKNNISIDDKIKQFSEPSGITIDSRGRIYVTDIIQDYVFIFDINGIFLNKFPIYCPEGGRNPCAPFLSFNPYNERLYIADSCNHFIGIYTLEGKFVTSFGVEGLGAGEFNGPANCAFDAQGNIYVVDSGNFRINSYSADLKFRFSFGKSGIGEGSFIRPYDIAIDGVGRIYLSDFILNSVQIFTPQGKYLESLKGGEETKILARPLGLAHSQSKIYVVNAQTSNVSLFTLSK